MKRIITGAIRAYQSISRSAAISPLLLGGFSGCRSWPSCSEYALRAIEDDGVFKGTAKAVLRIARCNPLWPAQRHG